MRLLLTLCFVLFAAGCSAPPAPDSTAPQTDAPQTAETQQATDAPEPTAESTEPMRVAALKGPTAMGMARLMKRAENGESEGNYAFTLGVIDEITPGVGRGDYDIACVPANLAAALYNNTKGQVLTLAINTLGVLYIVENGESVQSVGDLAGKTIYATGKGATPEYALQYILNGAGVKDASLEFKSEPAEVVALLSADGKDAVAMLPQPFVASALAKNPALRVALDLTAEWDKLSGGKSALVTGVVVVRKSFLQERPDDVQTFISEYRDSVNFTKENVKEAAALVAEYGVAPADIAEAALPACHIEYIDGAAMKEKLGGYLAELFAQNPQSVGGAMPNDDFYIVDAGTTP